MQRSADTAAAVELLEITKSFGGPGDAPAVANISLTIRDGEFFSLLGPSGSGKTTTLRMIAGFERPTAGRILLNGEDVTNTPPNERNVNTVFQDYALFPHMSVAENVAYGLQVRKVPAHLHPEQVAEALRMVRLEGFTDRKPAQLSGGQRQRVALARALINRPKVLLLDEPLGALDLKLREEMQLELKSIQSMVGITFIYVTHDQQEALAMSDRIAVFNRGRIEQVGSPAEVYERPATEFVADFVGTSNILSSEVAARYVGRAVRCAIRPEKIRILGAEEAAPHGEQGASGVVATVVYLGAETRYIIALDGGGELIVSQQNLLGSSTEAYAAKGRTVRLAWRPEHVLELAEVPQAPHN